MHDYIKQDHTRTKHTKNQRKQATCESTLFDVKWGEYSRVVLNRQVLSADHSVSLEPFATELLGGTIGGVGPLDGHTVVVGVLSSKLEGVAGDGDQDGLLGV